MWNAEWRQMAGEGVEGGRSHEGVKEWHHNSSGWTRDKYTSFVYLLKRTNTDGFTKQLATYRTVPTSSEHRKERTGGGEVDRGWAISKKAPSNPLWSGAMFLRSIILAFKLSLSKSYFATLARKEPCWQTAYNGVTEPTILFFMISTACWLLGDIHALLIKASQEVLLCCKVVYKQQSTSFRFWYILSLASHE